VAAPRQLIRFCVLVAAAFLSACGRDPPTESGSTGRIRFVNLLADGQAVNARFDDQPFGRAIPFGGSSPLWLPPPGTANYLAVAPGGHSIILTRSADPTIVVGLFTVHAEASEDRTVYATGIGGFTLRETIDDNTPPTPGTIRVRVVNFSSGAGPVDVFLTEQTTDLATATPVATNVIPGLSSSYFSVTPGTYRIRAVVAGVAPSARTGANVVVNLTEQSWASGGRTVVIAESTLANGFLVPRGTVLADQP
jgi:hypothetical protein